MGYSASYLEETADYSMDAQLVIRRSQESVTLPEELYDENEYPPLDPTLPSPVGAFIVH